MAVAHDQHSESHTGTTGSTSEAFFTWTHTPVSGAGDIRGVLVFVYTVAVDADYIDKVWYGASLMEQISEAIDTAGEPGRCTAFFIGRRSLVPQTAQTVRVDRVNNSTALYGTCCTVKGASDLEVYTAGIVKLEGDNTLAEQSVTDGSPGTNSLRYAAIYSGLAAPPGPGASSTALLDIDFGQRVCALVRETTAGQGARNVGFSSATSDDRAALHLAVREKADPVGPGRYPIIPQGYGASE